MALRLHFHFRGRCLAHPRYNPENDGRPKDSSCPGCETLFCIWLYAGIAERKAKTGEGLARQAEPEPEPETTAGGSGQSGAPQCEPSDGDDAATTTAAESQDGGTS
jgi:hypothetical protein